jgi:hypothetical protein
MSPKQIIVLVLLAIADICVLGMGVVILMQNMPQAARPAVTPAPLAAAASVTRTPGTSQGHSPTPASASATPPPALPTPTETHWPTWTSQPSRTPLAGNTPTSTQTPTVTPSRTATPSGTPKPSATVARASGGGASGTPSGGAAGGGASGGPGVPSNVIRCGTPNGQPTNGKLDFGWSIIAWRTAPSGPDRAIGTLRILASGGGDCYKYQFRGKTYDYEPIEFETNKCGNSTEEIIVTSADGQTRKTTFILSADDPAWRCK